MRGENMCVLSSLGHSAQKVFFKHHNLHFNFMALCVFENLSHNRSLPLFQSLWCRHIELCSFPSIASAVVLRFLAALITGVWTLGRLTLSPIKRSPAGLIYPPSEQKQEMLQRTLTRKSWYLPTSGRPQGPVYLLGACVLGVLGSGAGEKFFIRAMKMEVSWVLCFKAIFSYFISSVKYWELLGLFISSNSWFKN